MTRKNTEYKDVLFQKVLTYIYATDNVERILWHVKKGKEERPDTPVLWPDIFLPKCPHGDTTTPAQRRITC